MRISILVSFVVAVVLFFGPAAVHADASARKSTTTRKTVTASTAAARKAAARKKAARKKKETQRARRAKKAFVASADLRPMARQLLENRTRPAYAGVEAYARRHAKTDAGALAYFVLGYARMQDRDYPAAIAAFKRAQTSAGELDDYVAYFLGSAYAANGDSKLALVQLHDFAGRHEDSLFATDAAVAHANVLLSADRPAEAAAVLEKVRGTARGDVLLALGKAYVRAGEQQKGTELLRRVYYEMATYAEAPAAEAELNSLGALAPSGFAQEKSRADLLASARRYREAADEYRRLLPATTDENRAAVELALAIALRRSGETRDSRDTLERLQFTGEAEAQRLYHLADMARDRDDEDAFIKLVDQMRQAAPTSSLFEQTLLSAGNLYLLKKDYDRAIDFYREIDERFGLSGRLGAYAHWKAAWLNLRQRRRDQAKKEFEEQIAKYPASAQVPQAVYWRARLAEEDGDTAMARAYYQELSDRFRNYYYADLARERLAQLKDAAISAYPVLQRIPPIETSLVVRETVAPEDSLHAQKAMLLKNAGMYDYAVKELKRAAEGEDKDWAAAEIARMYQEDGRYDRALRTLKTTVPTYFALDLPRLPRFYWEGLFPRPFWPDLRRNAERNDLDPYLVASLIRQESEFNPGAVSRANALGLMQILPGTGKKIAREMKVRRFSSNSLLEPATNLQLGTRFFRAMIDRYNGTVEYALAAYNAGPDRVDAWLADGNFRDAQEFVESIPFTETREYVQAILRNASVYKRLYDTAAPSAVSANADTTVRSR